jgi:sulfatase maturation enzyme AslB (radical SAM superfamily)
MRITNSGNFEFCRWQNRSADTGPVASIFDTDPWEYFQYFMAEIRQTMLQGKPLGFCNNCYQMEKHQKTSGRQRQLLKTGIVTEYFSASTKSSPFYNQFFLSDQSHGRTDLYPVDWQIDLGNYCNGACIFCGPNNSTKLASEYFKLNLISSLPPRNWTDDAAAVDRFVCCLKQTPNLAYLHFIGGETLITPAFKIILSRLVDSGIAKRVSMGFTTNLMTWDPEINDLLSQFKEVNLGLSVECLHPINDYARWPSQINTVKAVLDQWVQFGHKHNWLTSIRTTPTLLSIPHLLTIYQYAWQHNVGIESCNFLTDPAVLRMSVLPQDIRCQLAQEIETWISQQPLAAGNAIVNTRDPNLVRRSILHDAASYVDYLRNAADETHLLPDLVNFLKVREASRNNSILDYLPEYEQFLRAAGY